MPQCEERTCNTHPCEESETYEDNEEEYEGQTGVTAGVIILIYRDNVCLIYRYEVTICHLGYHCWLIHSTLHLHESPCYYLETITLQSYLFRDD